ncbi:MAG: SusD/RagB family nutrient-binding outer membrane lipoprotein [Chitinophagaceae bacterium]|nr:MAG: SusD/RagB family nutrient-binding outer membrane lipoprotein [Chitinophagaceae bacterium]
MNISAKSKGLKIPCAFALLAAWLVFASGCTKQFESMNTDPSGVTNKELLPDFNNIGLYFPGIQQHIFGEEGDYQLTQNLNADCYSGYYMSPDPFRGNINNQSYALVDGWNSDIYSMAYGQVMGPVSTIASKGTRSSAPDFWAIALVLQVQAMDRVTDLYGPIPYSKVGQGSTTAYDSQEDVYKLFFLQLDTAVSNLQAYIKANPGAKPFAKFDMIYGGDYTEWLKYANSLRLRLAMHLSNIDPALAEAQTLKALDPSAGGVMTTNSDNATISGYGYHNPIWWIGTSWTDLSVGASMTSYLNGYHDPRMPIMVAAATSPSSIAGQYVGIRAGTPVGGKPMYNGYSTPNFNTIQEFTNMILMNAAEVWFLRAEAALRGWTTENPQTDYETGVVASMQQWGATTGNYLSDNTSTQANYTDPLTPDASVPNASINAISTVHIAWNPGATKERNLERIITQKWIAMFPCGGDEAWTEYRRTGYPRLFPVVVNNSGGTISTALQIRRLQYPSSEYNSNKAAVTAAVSTLGGPDNGGTPIWWDTNKGQAVPVNF